MPDTESAPMTDDLDRFLPLKHAHYMILLTLTEGDMHGYALKKRIEERTDGRTRLGAGSLYRSIGQLQDAGLVASSDWRPAPALDDDRREYVRLTDLGRRVAGAETDRLASLVATARAAGLGGGV